MERRTAHFLCAPLLNKLFIFMQGQKKVILIVTIKASKEEKQKITKKLITANK